LLDEGNDSTREAVRRRAEVRLLPVDEQHTRVHVTGEEAEVDRVVGDLRGTGLSGGGTGGTPGGGGGRPGTT
jgi:hypothetical protein